MSRLASSFKAFVLSMAAIAGFMASSQVAAAQSHSETFRIRIPFEYRVGKSALPAGEYTVSRVDPHVYMILGRDGKSSVTLLSNCTKSTKVQYYSSMVFHRYGDTYFLSRIWVSGDTTGGELPASRGEKEVMQAKLNEPPTLVELALK